MKINVHGGHAAEGRKYCGAVGLLNESGEDRLVASKLSTYLKKGGATVYGCTVSSGSSQTNVLEKICKKCNKHDADLDISIHFNSGRNDKKGDGKVGGFEVWAFDYSGKKKAIAQRCCKAMEKLGFTNRGLKTSNSLYYLKHTKAPALLFEICFVDDKDDYSYCRAAFLHIDSRSKKKQMDVFFYYQEKNKSLSRPLAETIRQTFEAKYRQHQPGRGFSGTVSTRGLYVLNRTEVPSVYFELGNLQNVNDQRRFVLSDNRQALANWITEAFVKDYKAHRQ